MPAPVGSVHLSGACSGSAHLESARLGNACLESAHRGKVRWTEKGYEYESVTLYHAISTVKRSIFSFCASSSSSFLSSAHKSSATFCIFPLPPVIPHLASCFLPPSYPSFLSGHALLSIWLSLLSLPLASGDHRPVLGVLLIDFSQCLLQVFQLRFKLLLGLHVRLGLQKDTTIIHSCELYLNKLCLLHNNLNIDGFNMSFRF